jgi:hypothetical protein
MTCPACDGTRRVERTNLVGQPVEVSCVECPWPATLGDADLRRAFCWSDMLTPGRRALVAAEVRRRGIEP